MFSNVTHWRENHFFIGRTGSSPPFLFPLLPFLSLFLFLISPFLLFSPRFLEVSPFYSPPFPYFSSFPLPSPIFPPLSSFPFEVATEIQLGGLGNAVSSLNGVWNGAPDEIECGAFSLQNIPAGGRLRCRFTICS